MSEYRAYNGKIDYDVDMWSNGDIYKNQYDTQRVYTDYIISSNTQNTYSVRDTTIDDQFEEQTQLIERYITAMEEMEQQVDETTQIQQTAQTEQVQQTVQVQQETVQEQPVTQVQQTTQQVQQVPQVEQTTQTQVQQTAQYTNEQLQNLYDQQVEQAFDDIEVLT